MVNVSRLPTPVTENWDWQIGRPCLDKDSAFFHPEGERGPARAQREARAKAICQTCPALDPCREHALKVQEPFGTWGGMSESERGKIIAEQRKQNPRR